MKKLFSLLTALVLILTLAGCGNGNDEEPTNPSTNPEVVEPETSEPEVKDEENETSEGGLGSMQIANPWYDFETIEEAFTSAGIEMNVPETIGSYKVSIYRAMPNEMLEIIYQDGDNMLHLRKAKGHEDISGHYGSEDYEVSSVNFIGLAENEVYLDSDNLIHIAVWYTDTDSYSLTSDTGLTNEEFTEVLNCIHLTVE